MRRVMFSLVLGLALAACGGNDASPDDPATNSPPPTEVDAPEPGTTDAADSGMDDPPTSANFGDAGPAVDACTLLTAEEVEAVLGESAVAEPEVSPPFYGCQWSAGALSSVSVGVFSWGDREIARLSFESYFGDATSVEGIGDGALYNELIDLAFILDSYEVTIDVTGDADAARAQARELAPMVISRLS